MDNVFAGFDSSDGPEIMESKHKKDKKSEKKEKYRSPSPPKSRKKKKHTSTIPIEDVEIMIPDRIMILGMSGSGKTNLLKCLVKQNAHNYDLIFLFSPNEHEEAWLPRECRYHKICMKRIEQIWAWAKTENSSRSDDNKYNILVILDDAAEGKALVRGDFFQDFITRCRHDNVSVIVCIQYLKIFPPCFRGNIQKYFICSANNESINALHGLCQSVRFYPFEDHLKGIEEGKVALLNFTPNNGNELSYVEVPLCENYKIKL